MRPTICLFVLAIAIAGLCLASGCNHMSESRVDLSAEASYPYPFSPVLDFTVNGTPGRSMKVVLYDISGNSLGVVYEGQLDSAASVTFHPDTMIQQPIRDTGISQVRLPLHKSLASGWYFFRVTEDDSIHVGTFAVFK